MKNGNRIANRLANQEREQSLTELVTRLGCRAVSEDQPDSENKDISIKTTKYLQLGWLEFFFTLIQ